MQIFRFSHAKTVAVILSFFSVLAFAAGTVFTDSDGSKLTIESAEHGFKFKRQETRYYPQYANGGMSFFKVKSTESFTDFSEGGHAQSTITGISKENGRYAKRWSKTALGADFKLINEELVALTRHGCCGAESIASLFRVGDGKVAALVVHGQLFSLEVPNSPLNFRYIGINVEKGRPFRDGAFTYLGSFVYFSADSAVDKVHVYVQLPEHWGASLADFEVHLQAPNSLGRNNAIELWASDQSTDATRAFSGLKFTATTAFDNKEIRFTAKIDGDRMSVNSDNAGFVKLVRE